MSRRDTMDIINAALFDDSIKLSPADEELKQRLKDIYSYWLSHNTLSDAQMVKYIQAHYHISRAQAYNDISRVKLLLSNIAIASRSWMVNKVNTILDEAANAARNGDFHKSKALAKVAECYISNNRLDTEEAVTLPYDEIVVKDFSFSINPEVAGVKKVPGILERAKKLKEKYLEDIERDEGTISK